MRALTAIVALALAAACNGGDDRAAPTPTRTPTTATPTSGGGALDFDKVETVAGGLQVPWDVAFIDAGTILVTERAGRVRLIRNGRLQSQPVTRIQVAAQGEGGLLGIAVHPNFSRERFAYVYYTASGGNRVSRFPLDDQFRFGEEDRILDDIPSASFHDGGRIAFGPDGMLYVTTGDAGEPQLAANRRSLAGKILRIAPDGSVPGDNPFRGSPVYSYGHRNPQGLAWDGQGRLFESEHGPTSEDGLCCHDEINLVRRGGFYGWPFRTGETSALSGGTPPGEPIDPIAESGNSTWAPAGLVVDRTDALLVTALRGTRLMRFPFRGGGTEVGAPATALDGYGRLRGAQFGPDGCLYLTTSNRDGRGDPGSNDDRILKICPG